MAASSPKLRAAATVKIPVISHTTSNQPGPPTCLEISAETRKIPEPIIDPATIIVESSKPSARKRPEDLSRIAPLSAIWVSCKREERASAHHTLGRHGSELA